MTSQAACVALAVPHGPYSMDPGGSNNPRKQLTCYLLPQHWQQFGRKQRWTNRFHVHCWLGLSWVDPAILLLLMEASLGCFRPSAALRGRQGPQVALLNNIPWHGSESFFRKVGKIIAQWDLWVAGGPHLGQREILITLSLRTPQFSLKGTSNRGKHLCFNTHLDKEFWRMWKLALCFVFWCKPFPTLQIAKSRQRFSRDEPAQLEVF